MEQQKTGYDPGFQSNRRGAAMVIVMCVLAVFLALSASILLTASVTLNTARNNVIFEQCKIQAVTLSDRIIDDMEDENSYLCEYIRKEIMDAAWPSYVDGGDKESATHYFSMDSGSDRYQIKMEMYWTSDDGSQPTESADADGVYNGDTKGTHLVVTVISTMLGGDFRVRNEFALAGILPVAKTGTTEYDYKWNWEVVGRK